MSESFVAGSAATVGTGTLNLTLPAGIQGGDAIFIAIASSQSGVTLPAGWVVVEGPHNPASGGSGETFVLYRKQAAGTFGGASSDASSVVAIAPNTTASKSAAVSVVWRGCDQTTPVHLVAYQEYASISSGTTSFASPTVNTTVDECDILQFWLDKNSVIPTITKPSAYTARESAVFSSGTGVSDAIAVSKAGGAAGVYGGESWTTTAAPGVVGIITLALAPATTIITLHGVSDHTETAVVGVPDTTNLFNNINEGMTDTSDYVEFLTSSVYSTDLPTVTDPGTDHGFQVSLALGLGAGASSTDWTIKLIQGTSTVRESWTETVTADPTEIVHDLADATIAAITWTSGVAAILRLEWTMTAAS
jgi:hypothetical protein